MAVDYSAQIAALNAAIAQAVSSVSYEGKSASFRSLDEMMKTVAYLERVQARSNGLKPANVGFASFSRGCHRKRYGRP